MNVLSTVPSQYLCSMLLKNQNTWVNPKWAEPHLVFLFIKLLWFRASFESTDVSFHVKSLIANKVMLTYYFFEHECMLSPTYKYHECNTRKLDTNNMMSINVTWHSWQISSHFIFKLLFEGERMWNELIRYSYTVPKCDYNLSITILLNNYNFNCKYLKNWYMAVKTDEKWINVSLFLLQLYFTTFSQKVQHKL